MRIENEDNISSYRLSCFVIRNGEVLFLESAFRIHGSCNDGLIITEDIAGAVKGKAKHSKFVSETLEYFDKDSHGNKFRAKGRALYRMLSFRIPKDGRHI